MKKINKISFVMIIALSLFSCKKEKTLTYEDHLNAISKSATLETNEQKLSYGIGYNFGKNFTSFLPENQQNQFLSGLLDSISNKESIFTKEQIQGFAKEVEEERKRKFEKALAADTKFMEDNKNKEGVQTTESGLQIQINKANPEGDMPKESDVVNVKYVGKLIDGKVFDSSDNASFPLRDVIPGFAEAIQMLKVGETATIIIPGELAYNEEKSSPLSGRVLIFDVELLSINEAANSLNNEDTANSLNNEDTVE